MKKHKRTEGRELCIIVTDKDFKSGRIVARKCKVVGPIEAVLTTPSVAMREPKKREIGKGEWGGAHS